MKVRFGFLYLLFFLAACKPNSQVNNDHNFWQSEWTMVENVIDEKYDLASDQFDDLLKSEKEISKKVFVYGLIAILKTNQLHQVEKLLSDKSDDYLSQFCEREETQDLEFCASLAPEKVGNSDLRNRILAMYVVDQKARGNPMTLMIKKYDLDSVKISEAFKGDPDITNVVELKRLIEKFGFPTREMVGFDAMKGVFNIIQHARDLAFMEEMLPHIKVASENNELSADSYAYLYDRILTKKNEKQLYGTQIKFIDFNTKELVFFPIEDSLNVDKRRMKYGLEPLELYKKVIIKFLNK